VPDEPSGIHDDAGTGVVVTVPPVQCTCETNGGVIDLLVRSDGVIDLLTEDEDLPSKAGIAAASAGLTAVRTLAGLTAGATIPRETLGEVTDLLVTTTCVILE